MTAELESLDDAWAGESGARTHELVLPLEGEMTIGYALSIKQSMMAALAKTEPGTSLRLDLGAVSEVDTSGVQLLLLARELTTTRAVKLSLMPVSAAVRQVLAFLNLGAAFEMPPAAEQT